jgi:hypothetical protein
MCWGANGASISTTGGNNLTLVSAVSWTYFYGLNFNCGTGASAADLNLNNGVGQVVYERCNIAVGSTNAGSDLLANNAVGSLTILKDCSTSVGHANTAFQIGGASAIFKIMGGQMLSANPNPLLEALGSGGSWYLEGFDCSSLPNTFNFINSSNQRTNKISIRNCKLPDSWTGVINADAAGALGVVGELMNSDDSDTNYRLRVEQTFGRVFHETTIVKTGGATDGVTPISWQVSSNPKSQWIDRFVETPEIVRWNTTVASPITCTIDIIHDSATALTNRQVWMEVQYLGTSGRPLSLFASTYPPFNAPSTAQAASGASWGGSMTNPNPQLLSTVITAQEAGFIHAKVMLAASSKAIYVDPVIQLS